LKKCSSERWGREKRFKVWRRGERRRTAFWRAAQNTLGASGAKPTRTCVPRTVNGTGQLRKLALRRQKDVAIALASIDASSVSSSTLLGALEDGSLFDGGLQARLARPHLNKWARPDSFTDSVVSSTSSSELSALGAW